MLYAVRNEVPVRSIGDELRAAGAARFVGRAAELHRFGEALASPGSTVLWLFGPGGIGKTALLGAMMRRAAEASVGVAFLDVRTIDPTPDAVAAAVGGPTGAKGGRRVVVIDTFERAAGLEPWLRTTLLPRLPAGSVVVVASRQAPDLAWRTDPAWADVLEVVPVRNLAGADVRELLTAAGVPAGQHGAAERLTRGHALALALLGDVVAGGPGRPRAVPRELADAPDVLAGLLGRIVDEVPDDECRRALDALALARVTSRGLARALFGEDRAPALFDWLAARPFVERVTGGLCPHELARDVLEGDLRRNDPERYAATHRAVRSHVLAQMGVPGLADAAFADLVYLHRGSSSVSSYWDWTTFGTVVPSRVEPGDEGELVAITERHLGPESVAALRHWLARQPERFTVVRETGRDEIAGFLALLLLDEPTPEDLEVDPAIAAVWAHARRHDPPRPGQVVGVNRFFLDRELGQRGSTTFNVVSRQSTRHWVTPGLAWDYIASICDAEYWGPMMDYLDFAPLGSGYRMDGRDFHLYGHDWRRRGPAAWLELMEGREIGETVRPAPPPPVLVALGEDEFADAVRQALRDLARPDRLATSPLLGSRVVRDAEPAPDGAALERVLRRAAASLPDVPRTAAARRALDRTYLHGAVTQEAAAEVLDLPFSTYRRHLAAGTALLVDVLWRWELYGPPAVSAPSP